MLLERSDWAAVNVELLTQALRLSTFKSKIGCEGTCKAWRKTLRDEPLEGIWGDMVVAWHLQPIHCYTALHQLAMIVADSNVRCLLHLHSLSLQQQHCK